MILFYCSRSTVRTDWRLAGRWRNPRLLPHQRSSAHLAAMGVDFRWSTALTVPVALGLLLAQYIALCWQASITYSDFWPCQPRKLESAWRAWDAGICLTDEQVWCRANGNRHYDCLTADCRAEEIRLTLYSRYGNLEVPSGRVSLPSHPIYDLGNRCFSAIRKHILDMNDGTWVGAALPQRPCGICVPTIDPRAKYVGTCEAEVSKCRSLYYRPSGHNSTDWDWSCSKQSGDPPITPMTIDYRYLYVESVRANQGDVFRGICYMDTSSETMYDRSPVSELDPFGFIPLPATAEV